MCEIKEEDFLSVDCKLAPESFASDPVQGLKRAPVLLALLSGLQSAQDSGLVLCNNSN